MDITNGGTWNSSNNVILGSGLNSKTVLTVDGIGSSVNIAGELNSGRFGGLGIINITNGGQLNAAAGFRSGYGQLLIDGSGSKMTTHFLSGTGESSLDIRNGGSLSVATFFELYGQTSLNVSGPLSVVEVSTANLISYGASVSVSEGGKIKAKGIYLGSNEGKAGVLNVGVGGKAGILDVPEVSLNDMAKVNFNHTDFLNFNSPITGNGSVNKIGSDFGVTALTGANTYTGGTNISSGALQVGNGGTTGSIVGDVNNNGALIFNRSDNITFSGVISGTGDVVKAGSGVVTLSGMNTYTGSTIIAEGTLQVDGSIDSSSRVTIAPGAVLTGSGRMPALVMNGTMALYGVPGTSLGISGNLTMSADSVYEARVRGAMADRINVAGTATLAGTLKLIPRGAPYVFKSPYTLLSAAGGRSGTFNKIDTAGTFGGAVNSEVSYTGNDVLLTLTPGKLTTFVTDDAPHNGIIIASAIDRAVTDGGDPSSLFAIFNQPAAAIPASVNQLSGELHTAAPALAYRASDQFLRAMLNPMAAGRLGINQQPVFDKPVYSIWASAFGSDGRNSGDSTVGSARRTISDTYIASGVDVQIKPGTIVGLAVSGGSAHASLAGSGGKIDADVFQAGLYGTTQLGKVRLGAAGSYARLDNDVSRAIPVLGSNLSSSYVTTAWSGRLQGSVEAASWNGLSLSPLVALQATRAYSPHVNEANGAGALTLKSRSETNSRGELGVQLDADSPFDGLPITGFARVAWAHYFQRDADLSASLIGLPGAGFKVTGAEANRNSALMIVGVNASLNKRVTVGFNLDSEHSGSGDRIGAFANARFEF
ncbi:autotransporter outer membrane beta-barrel domain-containing protein [Methylophilus luteus]|uniref:Autotransporter domain-containing protein n=1 Tax=Methylophilus luteus TaxID=640108 RepID=A0ABW3F9L1_9PROT